MPESQITQEQIIRKMGLMMWDEMAKEIQMLKRIEQLELQIKLMQKPQQEGPQ